MILIINNYPEDQEARFITLKKAVARILQKRGESDDERPEQIEILHFKDIPKKIPTKIDALILSGSTYNLPLDGHLFQREIQMVKITKKPLLGICFGHEILGYAHGAKVVKIAILKSRFEEVRVLRNDPLLHPYRKGDQIFLRESHQMIVKRLPEEFEILAETKEQHIEIMKHKQLPQYGVQGHLERATPKYPYGLKILENFLSIAKSYNE